MCRTVIVDFEVTNIVFVLKPGDNPHKPINPLVTGLFGAIAGAASVFGNTPLDVIKTRMQVRFLIRNYISLERFMEMLITPQTTLRTIIHVLITSNTTASTK